MKTSVSIFVIIFWVACASPSLAQTWPDWPYPGYPDVPANQPSQAQTWQDSLPTMDKECPLCGGSGQLQGETALISPRNDSSFSSALKHNQIEPVCIPREEKIGCDEPLIVRTGYPLPGKPGMPPLQLASCTTNPASLLGILAQ